MKTYTHFLQLFIYYSALVTYHYIQHILCLYIHIETAYDIYIYMIYIHYTASLHYKPYNSD